MNKILVEKRDDGTYLVESPNHPEGIIFVSWANVITEVRESINYLKPPIKTT